MLLEFDKAGAEWVIVAHLSRDPNMLEVVKGTVSPHVVTASLMYDVPAALVSAENKLLHDGKETNPEIIAELRPQLPELMRYSGLPRNMSMRQAGKKSNHGLNYDEGFRTFALVNEMEEREAKRIIELYHTKAYPNIRKIYHRGVQEYLRNGRTLTNCFGRVCYFMEAFGDELFKQGYAFLPQSSVGDMVNEGLILTQNSERHRNVHLLSQVHDSIVFNRTPQNRSLAEFRIIAQQCIEIADFMSPEIDYTWFAEKALASYKGQKPKIGDDGPFKVKTDLKIGNDWGHMHEVKLTTDEDKLAESLLATWESFQSATMEKAA